MLTLINYYDLQGILKVGNIPPFFFTALWPLCRAISSFYLHNFVFFFVAKWCVGVLQTLCGRGQAWSTVIFLCATNCIKRATAAGATAACRVPVVQVQNELLIELLVEIALLRRRFFHVCEQMFVKWHFSNETLVLTVYRFLSSLFLHYVILI